MLQAIRDAGFTNEVIFYHNNQSIIFIECEDYEASNAALRDGDMQKVGQHSESVVCEGWHNSA